MHSSVTTSLLHRGGFNLEVRNDVAAEHACLKSFDVASYVRLRRDEMPLIHRPMRLFVSVWHDDLASDRFHLDTARS